MRLVSSDSVNFVLRFVVGGLFLYAGLLKAFDFQGTVKAVENFHFLPKSLFPVVAILLPSLEIALGILLFFKIHQKTAAFLLSGVIVLFCVLLGASWARGLDVSCGCFGKSDQLTNYPLALLRNFILLGALGIIIALSEHKIARRYY